MCCERWSTRKTLTWIRDYHGPDGGDPHENKHRAATEALTLMDERDAAVALLRRLLSESYCRDGGWRCDEWDGTTCTHEQTRAFLTTLTPAEGEV